MNWLRSKLKRGARKYTGDGFSVRIEAGFRELVSVIYERDGASLRLGGERIGERWEGVEVHIPQEIETARAVQVARDLEKAFQAMGRSYVIAHLLDVEIVPEAEQEAAIAELLGMGLSAEVSGEQKVVETKWIAGAPRPDRETARKMAPRMMSLVAAVRGKRQRFEILARSSDFADHPGTNPRE